MFAEDVREVLEHRLHRPVSDDEIRNIFHTCADEFANNDDFKLAYWKVIADVVDEYKRHGPEVDE